VIQAGCKTRELGISVDALSVRASEVNFAISFEKRATMRAFRNKLQIDLRCPDAERFEEKPILHSPFRSGWPESRKPAGSLVRAFGPPEFAVGYKNHAVLPVEILDPHPKELSFVPHSGVAHQDNDVSEEFS